MTTISGRAPIRIVVVDDHDLFRTGLWRLLDAEDGLQTVGEARTGELAIQRAIELRPDVVVMDVSMPGISGIEATRAIVRDAPGIAVVMLTVSDDDDDVLAAVLAGATGYLLKDAPLPEIVRGIRAAADGVSLVAPRVLGGLLTRLREHGPREVAPDADVELSARELDVLRLVVDGCDNAAIGSRLHLSASTIKHHVSSLMSKLGVENRVQAAVLAVRRDLFD